MHVDFALVWTVFVVMVVDCVCCDGGGDVSSSEEKEV